MPRILLYDPLDTSTCARCRRNNRSPSDASLRLRQESLFSSRGQRRPMAHSAHLMGDMK